MSLAVNLRHLANMIRGAFYTCSINHPIKLVALPEGAITGFTDEAFDVDHVVAATGYRVDYDGRAICYVSDTEHVPGSLDRNILGLIAGAELVIYDCMYTDDEYRRYVGWGHSTWQEGVRLCKEAGAKRMVVFHHDPDHDDEMLDGIAREVQKALPGSVVAHEGLVLEP